MEFFIAPFFDSSAKNLLLDPLHQGRRGQKRQDPLFLSDLGSRSFDSPSL